jgi:tRNA G10  N-methylase Trm11
MADIPAPKMDYMIRFLQVHETFRLAEIEALAALEGINLEVLSYSLSVRVLHALPSQLAKSALVTILLRASGLRRCCSQTHIQMYPGQGNL